MRQSSTIRSLVFSFFLLVIFTLGIHAPAWSQGPQASGTPARSADLVPTSGETAAPPAAPSASAASKMSAIVIGSGDLLKIGVLGAPESDQEVRVDPDGNVSLSFIGSVHVAGITSAAAQELIAKKFQDGGFFTHPQVSVFIKEYATQGVSVLGEVLKPGVYPLLGSRRLFDVLSLAGGTSPKAGKVVSITHRDHPETPVSVLMSNDANESAKNNIEVFPGDTVLVSRAGVVYVVGDVHKPSGVIMDNGSEMTVLQAIAMAEGTNSTAKLNKAKLIRRTPSGPQEFPLALQDMLSSKAPDMRLQAEDIIFVPTSMAKTAGRKTLDAIIQTATGLAIYGVR